MRIEEVIGQNIRARREVMGWTQEELGRQLGHTLGREWPRQTVFSAEKGERSFTASELLALALTLQTTVQRLFRVPLGVDTVMVSPGISIDVALLEGLGAVEDDPSAELLKLKRLLNIFYNATRSRAHEAAQEVDALVTLQSHMDNLEQALRGRPQGDES